MAQRFGSSTPADISIAGQYTQCCRTMSLPIRWVGGHQSVYSAASAPLDPKPTAAR